MSATDNSTNERLILQKLDAEISSTLDYTIHRYTVRWGQQVTQHESVFKRQSRLGRGGFGEVWLEECVRGQREGALRAVKQIQKPTTMLGQVQQIDYRQELDAIARFSADRYKRHFVQSFGWYESTNAIYIAMEYVNLGDLQQYLRQPLPESEVRQIISQVLEGLGCMHELGYTHRDLKPQNLLVFSQSPHWLVKIADFGISKRVSDGVTSLRTDIGSPAFKAPEVMGFVCDDDDSDEEASAPESTRKSYTNAIDIWAVGVLMYLMLTGTLPFPPENIRVLNRYVQGRKAFPAEPLNQRAVSLSASSLLKALLLARPLDRPTAVASLQHEWFLDSPRAGAQSQPEAGTGTGASLPTGRWSTRDTDARTASSAASSAAPEVHRPANVPPLPTPRVSHGSDPTGSDLTTTFTSLQLNDESVPRQQVDPELPSVPHGAALTPVGWTLRQTLEVPNVMLYRLTYSPDGRYLSAEANSHLAGVSGVKLWHRPSVHGHGFQELSELTDTKYTSFAFTNSAFSPVGNIWALFNSHGDVSLFHTSGSMPQKAMTFNVRANDTKNYDGSFSPTGQILATFTHTAAEVRLWDATTGKKAYSSLVPRKGGMIDAVVFSPVGISLAVTYHAPGSTVWVSLFTLSKRRWSESLLTEVSYRYQPELMFHDDGSLLLINETYSVILWDIGKGAMRARLQPASRTVYGETVHDIFVHMSVSPDGKTLATACQPPKVQYWDLSSGKEIEHSTSPLRVFDEKKIRAQCEAGSEETVRSVVLCPTTGEMAVVYWGQGKHGKSKIEIREIDL